MGPLTELERAALELFLEGDDRRLGLLRSQLALALVRKREFTGSGFFTSLWLPADVGAASIADGVVDFADVHAEIPELRYGAGFVLFLKGGRLDLLEGYTRGGEPWPEEVAGFVLGRD